MNFWCFLVTPVFYCYNGIVHFCHSCHVKTRLFLTQLQKVLIFRQRQTTTAEQMSQIPIKCYDILKYFSYHVTRCATVAQLPQGRSVVPLGWWPGSQPSSGPRIIFLPFLLFQTWGPNCSQILAMKTLNKIVLTLLSPSPCKPSLVRYSIIRTISKRKHSFCGEKPQADVTWEGEVS